ncbi:MAG: Gfo/Idh/MocA family oxidoreductase [Planctomycetota bacterium]|nr:MAG: Gfo/Idh/MocA family oxidoreductase [Planctomycetota bacterium]
MKINRRTFVIGTASTAVAGYAESRKAGSKTESTRLTGKIRVAQIGLQGHCNIVLNGLLKTEDCELVAVARSMPGEAIESLKKNPACTEHTRMYDDYRKMLDETKPDLVAVFAPYAQNGPVNIEAARRGCHVISEKPLAVTMEHLNELRRQRDKNNIRVTALLPFRLDPMFMAAHQAVEEGLIGEPVLISAQKSYRWRGPHRPDYYKLRKTYGGTIPWVAIHAIDFIRFVSGLEYANVTARHAVKVHKDYPECEDCGALLFEMKNRGQATLTFDYLRPLKAPSHGDDRIRVIGSKGVIEIRKAGKGFCELITNEKPAHQPPLQKAKGNIFVDFVESLRSGKAHCLGPEDPFRATEVAIKARDAADTGKTITL